MQLSCGETHTFIVRFPPLPGLMRVRPRRFLRSSLFYEGIFDEAKKSGLPENFL